MARRSPKAGPCGRQAAAAAAIAPAHAPLQASSGSGDRHDDPLSPVHARSTSGDANAAEADRVSAAVGSAHTTTTLDRRCALDWGWSLFCTFVPHLVPRSFPSVVGNENTPDTRGYSFIPHVPHQMGISGLRARSGMTCLRCGRGCGRGSYTASCTELCSSDVPEGGSGRPSRS